MKTLVSEKMDTVKVDETTASPSEADTLGKIYRVNPKILFNLIVFLLFHV